MLARGAGLKVASGRTHSQTVDRRGAAWRLDEGDKYFF